MDDEGHKEIIRRLSLLDSKLNYLSGIVLCLFALSVGAIVYWVVSPWTNLGLAIGAAVIVGMVAYHAAERTFRASDP
jgi:hypothetical protein